MSTKITCAYKGDGQTELVHGPTGARISTDLPADNGGKGRTFSPTDLFASSLASCVLTIMAGLAERNGRDLSGTEVEIEKEMSANPRRVGRFALKIKFPAGVTAAERGKYLACVQACPVGKSLHPDVKVDVA
jgi:putative redox protein